VRSVLALLDRRMRDAIRALGTEGDPLLSVAQDERFGDYQSNCAMALAKQLGAKPRDVAQRLIDALSYDDLTEAPEIAGPGFINFRLKTGALGTMLAEVPSVEDPAQDRLGLPSADEPHVVVVDLSSPNLAKEMHVGHLRSTVIGDCVCRILEFAGHTVHRENHVGDWGTQFGMLVAHLRAVRPEVVENPDQLVIRDLESFYVEAKQHFDEDEDFRTEARETVVALQQGDPLTRRIWQAFCEESLRHCHEIYDWLDVRLVDRGESCYASLMEEVIERLEKVIEADPEGRVRISDGALCVFLDGYQTREGEPLPLIVRKRDGGHNYATSDLATILHRVETLGAQRIIYVVGTPQSQHFEMVFAAARQLGWVSDDVEMIHLGFGSMLAPSGRPFKTREGGTVKLKDLLDEAVERAQQVVRENVSNRGGGAADQDEAARADAGAAANREFTEEEIAHIAGTVGIAAVKYFDLSHALATDYKFNLDHMLAMEGNTAPYMLYAYARVRAIGRKGGIDFASLPSDMPILLDHPAERRLALLLLRFADVMEAVARDLKPLLLTDYLFELAKAFSRFYDRKQGVRVLDAEPEEVRISRLRLCDLTARTLRLGLNLLGIQTLEAM
jgi:arginyl-tRNA synthetase